MTAPITTTTPLGDPSDTWNTRQWINYIHAASVAGQTDPNAAQSAKDAVARLGMVNDKLSADDPERLKPGALSTFLVALGQGASLGLLNNLDDTKMYLQAGREAGHGAAATAGNVIGLGATTALAGVGASALGLGATAAGGVSGAATGAVQGAATADPGTRGVGALAGGAIGALLGAGGGYAAGKVLPVLQRIPWASKFFGGADLDMAEGQLRKELQTQGFSRAEIGKAASAWRAAQAKEAVNQSVANTAYKNTLTTLTARGVPEAEAKQTAQSVAERELRAYLAREHYTPENIEKLVAGRFGKPAAPPAAADVPAKIRTLQEQMGRDLTPQEKVSVIQRTPSEEPSLETPTFLRRGATVQQTGSSLLPGENRLSLNLPKESAPTRINPQVALFSARPGTEGTMPLRSPSDAARTSYHLAEAAGADPKAASRAAAAWTQALLESLQK